MKKRYDRPLRAEELAKLQDSDIDTTEMPPLDETFWRDARVVMPPARPKKQLTLRLDTDIFDWFKSTGAGYQTRINAVLRAYVETRNR